jgi:hypothetical protein
VFRSHKLKISTFLQNGFIQGGLFEFCDTDRKKGEVVGKKRAQVAI